MKKIIFTLATLSSLMYAFDMAGITDSVDKNKAIDSVNTDQVIAAASKGKDVEVEDVTKSVDGTKANESVDKEKLIKSLF